jgi:hypothetical protein
VVTGTTTGKLVLWDCKSYREKLEAARKQQLTEKMHRLTSARQGNRTPAGKDGTRDRTKSPANRELTRDTLKSSGSTRSGTLSSRKSSGKTIQQDDEDNNQQQISSDEQLLEHGEIHFRFSSLSKVVVDRCFTPLLDQSTDDLAGLSPMNKQPLKLCEPQKKPITVLIAVGE